MMGNEFMEAYLFEMNTLLEQLDDLVLAAEKAGTFSQDDINEIFRIMHTIKGSSAMMEFHSLMTISHRIEDLFYILREKTMEGIPDPLHPELFELIFQSIDFFRGEVGKLQNNESPTECIDSFLEKINRFSKKIQDGELSEEPQNASAAQGSATPAQSGAPGDYSSSAFPFTLQVFFDEGVGMEHLRAMMLADAVKELCEESQFDVYPPNPKGNPDAASFIIEHGFLLRFRTAEDRKQALPAVTASGSVRTYQLFDTPQTPAPEQAMNHNPQNPVHDGTKKAEGTYAQSPAASASPSSTQPQPHNGVKESLISVHLSKLDKLIDVVGEIVITESMVTSSPDLQGLKLDNFTQAARQLRALTDELQDVSMSLRMVPVSGTFQKMRRIVRDMGKQLGKETVLILEGEETEVDKTIVDSIGDPIMHIVRNSMDHGIENSAQDRIAAGKDPVGQIVLSAQHTGSEVVIEVRDDGRGADDEAILAKALQQGLAQPGIEYSHRDILNFLLMPGFSTNQEVTEFSGRGVGMDVVKSNVERVGGTVTITSEQGKGMTTTLKIPLTMAIMDGMEVSVGSSIFTIPVNNIRQIFRGSERDIIHDAAQGEIIEMMGNFYSIVRAKEFYRLESGVDSFEDGILLWVESAGRSCCLFVDQLVGEQQVVVKPLPSFVNDFGIKNYGVSGCTILGNGNISIILDVANICPAARS
ncbi:MAG: chemotaxis protein CheA [Lawsonibacter sp.]|nr:chemotaxis protein CheA [Lawsonibacter sp.]